MNPSAKGRRGGRKAAIVETATAKKVEEVAVTATEAVAEDGRRMTRAQRAKLNQK